MGQHAPRQEEGLGLECLLDMPVDTMDGHSFQETLVLLPIRLQGFGLRSFADTTLTAFIGGVELALGGEQVDTGWWRALLDTNSRTAREYSNCWDILQREGEQSSATSTKSSPVPWQLALPSWSSLGLGRAAGRYSPSRGKS